MKNFSTKKEQNLRTTGSYANISPLKQKLSFCKEENEEFAATLNEFVSVSQNLKKRTQEQ